MKVIIVMTKRQFRALTAEVQGLHSLTAAFEDEADRRTLFFMLG